MQKYLSEIQSGVERCHSRKFWRVSVFDTLDSTNDYLKSLALEKSEGEVVVARTQSSGRGRQNRTFHSLDGGLYFSVLLHPVDFPVSKITAMTAVAMRRAVKRVFDKTVGIKWVNDLYFEGKKVAGILAESSFLCENVSYVVLGVGVNVYEPKEGFPLDIQDIACALESEFGDKRGDLLSAFLDELYECYAKGKDFVSEYRESSVLLGKRVQVERTGEIFEGEVVEVDQDCKLVVKGSKEIRKFFSGEVIKVRV